MKQIKVFYSIRNAGDGSAYLEWFLTDKAAQRDQEIMDEPWGEDCCGSVETFEGSDIHNKALKNETSVTILNILERELDSIDGVSVYTYPDSVSFWGLDNVDSETKANLLVILKEFNPKLNYRL